MFLCLVLLGPLSEFDLLSGIMGVERESKEQRVTTKRDTTTNTNTNYRSIRKRTQHRTTVSHPLRIVLKDHE